MFECSIAVNVHIYVPMCMIFQCNVIFYILLKHFICFRLISFRVIQVDTLLFKIGTYVIVALYIFIAKVIVAVRDNEASS